MDAPLASIIADVFMTNLETTLMDDLINAGVCEWHRYVDDTFIEDGDKLEFLDVLITRSTGYQLFETTIYRKPTYADLLTNYHSYVSMQYKNGGIITMVNRALIICSTYTSLAAEFNEIRRIGLLNGYTSSFIDTIIGIKLSQYRKKNNDVIQSPQSGPDVKKRMYVEIPFIENATKEFRNKITHLCNKLRLDLDIQFFMKPSPAVQMLYQTKDPTNKKMKSDVVYSIKCTQCQHSYIGKTERQCIKRLHEHGAPKSSSQPEQQHPKQQDDNCTHQSNNIVELRRSGRLKNKPTTTITTPSVIKEITFAVQQHQIETRHQMNWDNFRIFMQDNHYYRLLIKESLLIKAYEPELNRTTHSVPLIVFSDGLQKELLPRPFDND
ncbi:unnamed protein product [Rotaria socialis]|nr:unnamed protein product [Rotaria socialis]